MERQPGLGAKIATTAIIWGFATGMLAICIPLVAMTKSGVVLPLAVILGASGVTAVVWVSSDRQTRKISNLTNSVQLLEQRIVDLETICSSDEFSISQKLKQIESKD